ncbi:hypothetical protein DO66_6024 [Burkholderia pseudomallei]|nr:hypothetical protein DO66_6024 [Burkholderia pseudomallei]
MQPTRSRFPSSGAIPCVDRCVAHSGTRSILADRLPLAACRSTGDNDNDNDVPRRPLSITCRFREPSHRIARRIVPAVRCDVAAAHERGGHVPSDRWSGKPRRAD